MNLTGKQGHKNVPAEIATEGSNGRISRARDLRAIRRGRARSRLCARPRVSYARTVYCARAVLLFTLTMPLLDNTETTPAFLCDKRGHPIQGCPLFFRGKNCKKSPTVLRLSCYTKSKHRGGQCTHRGTVFSWGKRNTMAKELQDVRRGKPVPWRQKKRKTVPVAQAFFRLEQGKKAVRVLHCGDYLAFLADRETQERKLHDANFCRERLCPMCAWRRSLKVFRQVSQVMDYIDQDTPGLVPLFLTLTIRNCEGEQLAAVLDRVFSAWNKLLQRAKLKRVVQGWFRALEITRGATGSWHPHLHVILLVREDYFIGQDYMPTTTWVQMWREALQLDYNPICDVRRMRSMGSRKAVAEVAKYTVKDTDYVSRDPEQTQQAVDILSRALRGRRLFAFGGCMREAAQVLRQEELGEGDLIHVDDDEVLRDDLAKVIEIYRWDFGAAKYLLSDK